MPHAPRDHSPILVDVAIVGTGAAGLWLANLFAGRGFSVAVCDPRPLGGVQTAAAQGLIHGGVKYALGKAERIDSVLAAMPARWRACLAGEGEVDLRGVRIVSEQMHLFSHRPGTKARALLDGLAAAGRARRVQAANTPPFQGGALFETGEFVIDVPALVRCLAARLRHRVIAIGVDARSVVVGPTGVKHLRLAGRELHASAYVFAAGAGNEALAGRVGAETEMRLRPLRQTCVWPSARPPPVYAHCIANPPGAEPELTVTSHGAALYVGGKVASDGAARDEAEQIEVVRASLREHLPGLDLAGATFKTVFVERAEPASGLGDAFAARRGNCLVCWPNKLSLVPRLGDLALAAFADLRPGAAAWPGDADGIARFAAPPYACPPRRG